jgi:hypothetical protein
VHTLLVMLAALGIVALIVLPVPLAGRALERRRAAAGRAAVAGHTPTPAPAGPALADLDMAQAVDDFVAVVGAEYRRAASVIGDALAAFCAPGQRADGQPRAAIRAPKVNASTSIEIALLHLRYGVLEPASAYRPATTSTQEHDFAGLRQLLAAEEALAVA